MDEKNRIPSLRGTTPNTPGKPKTEGKAVLIVHQSIDIKSGNGERRSPLDDKLRYQFPQNGPHCKSPLDATGRIEPRQALQVTKKRQKIR
jgi:hypothetical protein